MKIKYDGPKGAWTNHIKSSKTNMVTEYSSDYGTAGIEVVNKFLTVLDNSVNIELDAADKNTLCIDFSYDLILSIPETSFCDCLLLLGIFLSENQEYVRYGNDRPDNSICISLNILDEILGFAAPYIEITPEQIEDFIVMICGFLDRNCQYLQSLCQEIDEKLSQPSYEEPNYKTIDIELIAISKSLKINADEIVDISLKYIAPLAYEHQDSLSLALDIIKTIYEGNTPLGAKILNFVLDGDGVAYHSQPSTWQKAFGYNDLYDLAFDIGSDMDKAKYDFKSNDVTYALWMWKGDYWNLQSGAEIGLYYIDNNRHQVNEKSPHYYSIDYTLPMSLSLYNYEGGNYTNVFCWYPDEKQWWITGFNAHSEFCEPHPEDMIAIGSIDFSSVVDLYDDLRITSFKGKENLKNYFYFDDKNCTLWIIFTEDDRREYNFEFKFF